MEDRSRGATITFSVNATTVASEGPRVNAALVGIFPTVGQTLEDRYGKPLEVSTDINGKGFSRPVAGPLADLKEGLNTIVWPAANRE